MRISARQACVSSATSAGRCCQPANRPSIRSASSSRPSSRRFRPIASTRSARLSVLLMMLPPCSESGDSVDDAACHYNGRPWAGKTNAAAAAGLGGSLGWSFLAALAVLLEDDHVLTRKRIERLDPTDRV